MRLELEGSRADLHKLRGDVVEAEFDEAFLVDGGEQVFMAILRIELRQGLAVSIVGDPEIDKGVRIGLRLLRHGHCIACSVV